jgi:glycosyltransferase involved in cell wall biosynthesis
VVGVSEATASDAREYGVMPSRIHLIRNGIDTLRFTPSEARVPARDSLGVPKDGTLIGVVGRFSEEKGHTVLLDAVARLDTSWRLALIGDGPLEMDLRAKGSALGISDRTHYVGRRDDMKCVYPALDVLALPSHREGLPLAVLEAGACGLPVAATDVGDVGRVVLDGVTGFLSPAGDSAAMSRSLERLCFDSSLRARMGAAARCHVEASFAAPSMAAAYEVLYREAAGR